jgi:K+-sensing histidine kinase KdpD
MHKALLGSYGSDALAPAALAEAKREHMALMVCFIRELHLSIKWEERLTAETDQAAQKIFARFLELGHEAGVPVIPVYDQGPDAAVLMAETAATYGVEKIFIGTTRRGTLHHLIKGHFQRQLETLLPPEIKVKVISPEFVDSENARAAHS